MHIRRATSGSSGIPAFTSAQHQPHGLAQSPSGPLGRILAGLSRDGQLIEKTVPRGRFGATRSWPPCASTISRHIDRPSPSPLSFVAMHQIEARQARKGERPEGALLRGLGEAQQEDGDDGDGDLNPRGVLVGTQRLLVQPEKESSITPSSRPSRQLRRASCSTGRR
jgi:hypothetical protein